jgi:hypothetical protein
MRIKSIVISKVIISTVMKSNVIVSDALFQFLLIFINFCKLSFFCKILLKSERLMLYFAKMIWKNR